MESRFLTPLISKLAVMPQVYNDILFYVGLQNNFWDFDFFSMKIFLLIV